MSPRFIPPFRFHYPQVWRSFLASGHTIPTQRRDFPDWHRGRPRYWCWVLEIDCPTVVARWRRARQRLSACLREDRRLPHITLAACGFLQAEVLPQDDGRCQGDSGAERFIKRESLTEFSCDDDFSFPQLQRQMRALSGAADTAFDVHIGGVNSFASAAFLEVSDPSGGLERLRQRLLPATNDFRNEPYCPHLTLGLYRRRIDCRALAPVLYNAVEATPLALQVSSLALVSYASDDVGSPLRLEQRVLLKPAD